MFKLYVDKCVYCRNSTECYNIYLSLCVDTCPVVMSVKTYIF